MATTEEQIAAWEYYRQARAVAERTMCFDDGRSAALAWNAFAELFVEPKQMPVDLLSPSKVVIFPVHKTRAPGVS